MNPHRTESIARRIVPIAATPQERCRAIAARHGVRPEAADDCTSGSVGCPDCPWQSGWSQKYLYMHGITSKPANHSLGAST